MKRIAILLFFIPIVCITGCRIMGPQATLPDSADVYRQSLPYHKGTTKLNVIDDSVAFLCFTHPVVQNWQQQASGIRVRILLRAPDGASLLWKQDIDSLSPDLFVHSDLCFPLQHALDEGLLEMTIADKGGNLLAQKFMRLEVTGEQLQERKISGIIHTEELCASDAEDWHFFVYSHGLPLPIYEFQEQLLTLVPADSLLEQIGAGTEPCYQVANEGLLLRGNNDTASCLMVTEKGYPDVRTPSMMMHSLRYLWYDSSRVSIPWRDQKYLVDSFWLSLATHQEQARKLLQAYYRRVVFANSQFTDWRPGYLTDRGEVYLLLGPPDALYVTMDTERWVYYPEGNGPGEQLVFRYRAAKSQPRGWYLDWKPHYASLLAWGRERWLRGKILFFQVQD
ncbi:MAG: GWxTD domain-containing protein [Bacteroidales bacterium]